MREKIRKNSIFVILKIEKQALRLLFMSKTINWLLLLLFQLAGFAEVCSLYMRWQTFTNEKALNYFLIIGGMYSGLWLLIAVFSGWSLQRGERFLALFSTGSMAVMGGFVYFLMQAIFPQ